MYVQMASKTIAESSNRSSPQFLSLLDVEGLLRVRTKILELLFLNKHVVNVHQDGGPVEHMVIGPWAKGVMGKCKPRDAWHVTIE